MKKIVIGMAIMAVVGVAVFAVAGAVNAQSQDQGFLPRSQSHEGKDGSKEGPLRDLMTAAWAEALGMSVEDLEAALEDGEKMHEIAAEAGYEGEELKSLMESVHAQVLEQAVSEGIITQEEADKIDDRGPKGKHGRRGDGNHEDKTVLKEYITASLADALGLTTDELQSRLDAGERPHEIAADLGLDDEAAKELFQSAWQDAVDQALADGAITQDQADQLKERSGRPGRHGPRRDKHDGIGSDSDA